MARTIIGVIVGYVVMFMLIFATFTCVFLIMGAEWSFKPGSFEASNGWIAMSIIADFIVAVVAGLVCALIAGNSRAAKILAIVVFVLGLLLAIPSLVAHNKNANLVRAPGPVTQAEAMQKASEPTWLPFVFPVVGVAGVLLGGRLKRQT